MKPYYRTAMPEDVIAVARNLRPADRAEMQALGHHDIEETLLAGVASSGGHVMIDRHGIPFGLFGVARVSRVPVAGKVWMVATEGLEREALAFARVSREIVTAWEQEFDILFNAVDGRNETHVKWLKWLGFQFLNTVYVSGSIPFHEFVKVKHHV